MNLNKTASPQKIFETIGDQNRNNGGFGAVIARAGVGKTALLVQIALCSLLEKKTVLHVSLKESIQKVCIWYDEVSKKLERSTRDFTPDTWDTILMHRMIMTFGENQFSPTTLKQRLSDLTEQDIFYPQLIVIDGLMIDHDSRPIFEELKALAKELSVFIWFSIRSHRHQVTQTSDLPPAFIPLKDLFDTTLQVIPKGDTIDIKLLSETSSETPSPELVLDPETMLIRTMVQ